MKAALLGIIWLPLAAYAADPAASEAADPALERIEVRGVKQRLESRGRVADMIEKTELVDAISIFQQQAATLSEAIENAPGIRVNNECSMCGVKRVMINGLKGEHTTILVDGVPMHSVVSSYYGMDAISTAGVDAIEIARGSGASLIAPGAVGGTINIVTKTPIENELMFDLSVGEKGYKKLDLYATGVNQSGDLGVLLTAQRFTQDQFDADANGVSEAPSFNNGSASVKLVWDLTDWDNLELRYGHFSSDIFGGPMGVSKGEALASERFGSTGAGSFFAQGDVRQAYQGLPWEVTETIDTSRDEWTGRWTHEINDDWHTVATLSYVDHGQDSYYEGFDYTNTDSIWFVDLRAAWYLNDAHLLTMGVDGRSEKMRSSSYKLKEIQAADPAVSGDSFDQCSLGAYLQDNWVISDNIELQWALRLDKVEADFIEKTAQSNEIERTLLSPRANLRWDHSERWTSRLSAGQGYRAPLTFFESDHGILEDGFEIAVDDLEVSRSVGYALSFLGEQLDATASLNYTEVDNLAFIDVEHFERPTLINRSDTIDVTAADLMWGYRVNAYLRFDGGFEWFNYSDNYKETFAVVPVESRVSIGMDIDYAGWDLVTNLVWYGPRDLVEYGYSDRYNIFDDANGNDVVDDGELQGPKSTDAKAYFTLDIKLSTALTDNTTLYIGATNLLDYTQAGDLDSPLYWYNAGGEAGFDVAHIYGPMQGRQAYAGIKIKL